MENLSPREFHDAHASTSGFAEYQQRRLQLVDTNAGWLGPPSLGYSPKEFAQRNGFPFRVVRLSDAGTHLTYPDLLSAFGDGPFEEQYAKLWAHQKAKVKRGRPMIGVGVGLVVTGIVGVVMAAWSGGFSGSSAPGAVMAGVGLGAGIPILAVGASQLGGGRLTMRLMRTSERIELYYDRDDVWEAVESHNSSLRKELGLPDDARLDAPSSSDEGS